MKGLPNISKLTQQFDNRTYFSNFTQQNNTFPQTGLQSYGKATCLSRIGYVWSFITNRVQSMELQYQSVNVEINTTATAVSVREPFPHPVTCSGWAVSVRVSTIPKINAADCLVHHVLL